MNNSIELNGLWRLEGTDPENNSAEIRVTASVPGHVHYDLLAAGKISNPFYRKQADDCQWIEQWQWTYSREFEVEALREGYPILEFEGIDTFADIYLNGKLLAQTDNMFLRYRFDVGGLLRKGTNSLQIKFKPIAEAIEGKPYGSYNAAFTSERVYIRRMQCTFGWDWVNRFVSYGIWRPVRLVYEDTAAICDLFVYTRAIDSRGASLHYRLETRKRIVEPLWAEMAIANPAGRTVWHDTKKLIGHALALEIDIPEPEIWWPAGYGGQPIYTAITTLRSESGHILDERRTEFGIRTVRIERLQDQPGSAEAAMTDALRAASPQWDRNGERPGSSFTLIVNGVPVFCKGANWVPCDPFPSRVPDAKYEHLIRLAQEANINMLRCWGGGIYEPESFWRWCDRLGILVCQDFLMACASYPEEDVGWTASLQKEVEENIRSLRNHPSLVWWNGDNENGMYQNEDDPSYPGRQIAERITGRLCAELDPSRPFLPTSPYGGYPNLSFTVGTAHYTGVCLDIFEYIRSRDMRDYRGYFAAMLSRFCPEFPMFGTPEVHTLLNDMTRADLEDPSFDMLEYHTKNHPALIDFSLLKALLMLTDKLMPPSDSIEEQVRKMSYTQHELTRIVMEAYRRNRFYASGLLFWMYNDCWPASGWSWVDYYGFPKAGYYAMKRAAQPVIASIDHDGKEGKFTFWVCNDLPHAVSGTGNLRVLALNGEENLSLWSHDIRFEVGAGSSSAVDIVPDSMLLRLLDENHVLVMKISGDFGTDRTVWFNGIPAEMKLAPSGVRIMQHKKGLDQGTIVVSAERYAKAVTLHGRYLFSDNYFDLLPGESRTIRYRSVNEDKGSQTGSEIELFSWNS